MKKNFISRDEQILLLRKHVSDFLLAIETMVDSRCELCPELQQGILDKCRDKDRILKIIWKMNQKRLWLTPAMLIFWLENADRNVPQPKKKGLFSSSPIQHNGATELSPWMELLKGYCCYNSKVPLPASFLTETVQDPDFAQLHKELDLTGISDQDKLILVNREDIIRIMEVNKRIELSPEAELILAKRGYKELFAYVENSKTIAYTTFEFVVSQLEASQSAAEKEQQCDDQKKPQWTDENVANLLLFVKNKTFLFDKVDRLLKRHNFSLSKVVIEWTRGVSTKEQQEELLATPNAKELFILCMNYGQTIHKDYKVKIFDMFDPHTELRHINNLLPGESTREFADRLASLLETFDELDLENKLWWRGIGEENSLWGLLMETPLAEIACRAFFKEYGENVTEKMLLGCLQQPNAPKLFAILYSGYHGSLSEDTKATIINSPNGEIIQDLINFK